MVHLVEYYLTDTPGEREEFEVPYVWNVFVSRQVPSRRFFETLFFTVHLPFSFLGVELVEKFLLEPGGYIIDILSVYHTAFSIIYISIYEQLGGTLLEYASSGKDFVVIVNTTFTFDDQCNDRY